MLNYLECKYCVNLGKVALYFAQNYKIIFYSVTEDCVGNIEIYNESGSKIYTSAFAPYRIRNNFS